MTIAAQITYTEMISPLSALNWNDVASVNTAATKLLDQLADDRAILADLVERLPDDAHLASLCEHYDILDKLVLHDDPTGWRLRLHIFLDGYFDRPHNHRWTYTSRILTGSYTHTLYGTDHDFTDEVDVSALTPRMVRVEEPGDTYTLHHSMIHSVTAHGEAVTLIVRGPAVKDRFVVTDRTSGRAWWQYGAANETPEAAAAKRMTSGHLSDRIAALRASGVFAAPRNHD
ncbi:hypothetical protein O7632_30060 [Solwaraspora sp. WMMD406]|uniref:hypothetical protein n=1 Tax=Solwaraspora sp. WMMD406 TaxID=3016095 RepID=UPI0024176401|nr:hypothetical protein [Solwaraspora sp. WMMD406]MDG4768304.1 hypothetical protein [Solwaraspora sp. WMMD406]